MNKQASTSAISKGACSTRITTRGPCATSRTTRNSVRRDQRSRTTPGREAGHRRSKQPRGVDRLRDALLEERDHDGRVVDRDYLAGAYNLLAGFKEPSKVPGCSPDGTALADPGRGRTALRDVLKHEVSRGRTSGPPTAAVRESRLHGQLHERTREHGAIHRADASLRPWRVHAPS